MSNESGADKEIMKKKHERAMKLRAEYIKQISNPFRHASGEGGTLLEPSFLRFQAMRISNYDHFRPTGKNFYTGLLFMVLPVSLFAFAFKSERDGREHKYRTGQVAYKDRRFKFI